jgi:hypothetical protein
MKLKYLKVQSFGRYDTKFAFNQYGVGWTRRKDGSAQLRGVTWANGG